jgi:hypothetical protein
MSILSQTLPHARSLSLALAMAAAPCAWAQTANAGVPAEATPAESAPAAKSERIERITHEDELSRIDELRVGGQTRSIEVQPKNGAPSYEIAPAPGGADLSDNSSKAGSTGKSRWRIFNF